MSHHVGTVIDGGGRGRSSIANVRESVLSVCVCICMCTWVCASVHMHQQPKKQKVGGGDKGNAVTREWQAGRQAHMDVCHVDCIFKHRPVAAFKLDLAVHYITGWCSWVVQALQVVQCGQGKEQRHSHVAPN